MSGASLPPVGHFERAQRAARALITAGLFDDWDDLSADDIAAAERTEVELVAEALAAGAEGITAFTALIACFLTQNDLEAVWLSWALVDGLADLDDVWGFDR